MYRASRTRLMCPLMPVPGHSDIWAPSLTRRAHRCVSGWQLVPDQSETRRERPGAAARIGFGELPDRLDHAAPVSTCHAISPGPGQAQGLVEVDETYLSITDRKNPATTGRKSSTTKVLMVMAVEIVEPKGFGASGYAALTETPPPHVIPFSLQEVVEPGAQVPRMVRRHTALWENWVTPTSAPSCSAQAYLPMSPWRECTGSPTGYSAGCWEHIMVLCSQTTWTPISMNSCSVSTGAHPAHAGCCFTACCSLFGGKPVTYGDVVSKNTGERQSVTIAG